MPLAQNKATTVADLQFARLRHLPTAATRLIVLVPPICIGAIRRLFSFIVAIALFVAVFTSTVEQVVPVLVVSGLHMVKRIRAHVCILKKVVGSPQSTPHSKYKYKTSPSQSNKVA